VYVQLSGIIKISIEQLKEIKVAESSFPRSTGFKSCMKDSGVGSVEEGFDEDINSNSPYSVRLDVKDEEIFYRY
jgi:hypothetical protein